MNQSRHSGIVARGRQVDTITWWYCWKVENNSDQRLHICRDERELLLTSTTSLHSCFEYSYRDIPTKLRNLQF
jgi:hypothetical protein